MHRHYEISQILTVSTAHLHPWTRNRITACGGELLHCPLIAIREHGFFVNSSFQCCNAFINDFSLSNESTLADSAPDLALLRVLARGLRATWINIDCDGDIYTETLPTYDDDGTISLPTDLSAPAGLFDIRKVEFGVEMAWPSLGYLLSLAFGNAHLR